MKPRQSKLSNLTDDQVTVILLAVIAVAVKFTGITVDFGIVIGFGVLIGSGELLARYRDDPVNALLTIPGRIYVAINGAAAAGALALIRLNGWTFGVNPADAEKLRWIRIVVAGFGAMAVFRSSLFNVQLGNQEVSIGPSAFLDVAMSVADSAVDRKRAQRRAELVRQIMARVMWDKAQIALPQLCASLMQNLSADQKRQVEIEAKALTDSQLSPWAKVLTLGLLAMDRVSDNVLYAAVTSLGDEILTPAPQTEQPGRNWLPNLFSHGGPSTGAPTANRTAEPAKNEAIAATPPPAAAAATNLTSAPTATTLIADPTKQARQEVVGDEAANYDASPPPSPLGAASADAVPGGDQQERSEPVPASPAPTPTGGADPRAVPAGADADPRVGTETVKLIADAAEQATRTVTAGS